MPTEIKRCGYCESNKIEHEFQENMFEYLILKNLERVLIALCAMED